MPIIPDPPLRAYEPYFQPGAVILRWRTLGAEPVFSQMGMSHLLRTCLREVQKEQPFRLQGWVILPAEVHLLLRPTEGAAADQIARLVRHRFQAAYPEVRGLPHPIALWDRDRFQGTIPDLEAFALGLDRLHYAPVAQGLRQRPEDWEESSYAAWIERRLYRLGWGWHMPDRLQSPKRQR